RKCRHGMVEQLRKATRENHTKDFRGEGSWPIIGSSDHVRSQSQHFQTIRNEYEACAELRAILCVRRNGSQTWRDGPCEIRGWLPGDYRICERRPRNARLQFDS